MWLMITVVGAVGGAIPLMAIWTTHQEKVAKIAAQDASGPLTEKAARLAAENRELAERLNVLERIVTDQGFDTARQIEALRDPRQIEDRQLVTEESDR